MEEGGWKTMSSREREKGGLTSVFFAVAFFFRSCVRGTRLENGLVLTALGPLKGDLHLLHRVSCLFSVDFQLL
jgi:hypothetical protein